MNNSIKKKKTIFPELVLLSIILTVALSCMDYFSWFGFSRDRGNYNLFFDAAYGKNRLDIAKDFTHEVGFQYLTSFLFQIGIPLEMTYSFQVSLSLLPKLLVISFISSRASIRPGTCFASFLLATVFYLCKFFPLHELTQLRASLSSSFIFVGTAILISPQNSWRKRTKNLLVFLCYSASVLFHLSAIAVIPIIYIAKRVKTWRSAIFAFILMLILSAIITQTFLLAPAIKLVFAKADVYSYNELVGITLFSVQRFLDIALIISFRSKVEENSRVSFFAFTFFLYSLAIFYGVSAAPVYSYRISELIQVVGLIFLVASGANKRSILGIAPFVIVNSLFSLWSFLTQDYFFNLP
jgi:EpsG family